MPDSHLPKQVIYSQLAERKRAPGGQKKKYKDNIKTNLKKFHIDFKAWEDVATDRPTWGNIVCEGAAHTRTSTILHKTSANSGRRVCGVKSVEHTH